MKRLALILVLSFGLVIAAESPALAYFDAATGGLVVQAVLGGIAGISVLLRLYWRRLVRVLKGRSGEEVAE
jgi:hypothetical protein